LRITSKHALITGVSIDNSERTPIIFCAEDVEALRIELIGQVYSDVKLSMTGSRNHFVTATVEQLRRVL